MDTSQTASESIKSDQGIGGHPLTTKLNLGSSGEVCQLEKYLLFYEKIPLPYVHRGDGIFDDYLADSEAGIHHDSEH